MSGMDELNQHMQAILDGLSQQEIAEAHALRAESQTLFQGMMLGNYSEYEILDNHKKLLKKFIDFEGKLLHFEILQFMYAEISRVHLHLDLHKEAIQYAQAGLELNKQLGDHEGAACYMNLLMDIACYMGGYNEAIKIIKKQNPDNASMLIAELQSLNSTNDALFKKLLKSAKRPKSFVFCTDKERAAKEQRIRRTMQTMHVSRATAINYAK